MDNVSSEISSGVPDTGFPFSLMNTAPETEFVEAPFLIFRLGASLFGVPSLAVREIHALPALSVLQESAPFIVGVLNLRGAIVPVMDLSVRFGQSAMPYRLDDSVVVLSWGGAEVAIIVNEVHSVERLAATQIEAMPTHGRQRELPSPFVAGVTQINVGTNAGIVMLLHLAHLLNWPVSGANAPSDTSNNTLAPRFDLQAWAPDERAVLETRATRLRPNAEDEAKANEERVPVAFVALGGEEFGIELGLVREFVSVSAVAPVPCCPPHILGQFSLRGDIVTLVDVRPTLRTTITTPSYFDSASSKSAISVPVVVVQHEGAPVGIVIDNVRDVLYLREDERFALDMMQSGGHNGKYFSGGALHNGRLLPLLDVGQLFIEGDLEVDD